MSVQFPNSILEVVGVGYNRGISSLSETWTLNDTPLPKSRRRLSADGLIQVIRNRLANVQDKRRSTSVSYSMVDSLMAAFALFFLAMFSLALVSLKGSSTLRCLAFQDSVKTTCRSRIFFASVSSALVRLPSDTAEERDPRRRRDRSTQRMLCRYLP